MTSLQPAPELLGRSWLGTNGQVLSLTDLRGKIVLLDFWTLCCINCHHVLDELRQLEEKFPTELVIIGVHSPKFAHEADPAAVAAAVQRHEIHHPVLDDPQLRTWRAYGARAWPTLVLINPSGKIVAQMAGEGHGPALAAMISQEVQQSTADGTLRPGPNPFQTGTTPPSTLRFPAKAVAITADQLLVADAGHHTITQISRTGQLIQQFGSGQRGLVDGPSSQACFAEPNGLCLLPPELAEQTGFDLVVADTANHALRSVRLSDGKVSTLASPALGNMPFAGSPWAVAWQPACGRILVALAGLHQIGAFSLTERTLTILAGTSQEGLVDGPAEQSWLAQPSALAVTPDGTVYFADAETSALRELKRSQTGFDIHTYIGQGLFNFGQVDGPGHSALLQHPLGLAVLPGGQLIVADTYNGALRHWDPATGQVSTVATGLAEPSDVVVFDDCLVVVESSAHRLTELAWPAPLQYVDDGGQTVSRPPLTLSAGSVRLNVPFTPGPGLRLDERYGSATSLLVEATPSALLVEGSGSGSALNRDLVLAPGQGVLHITARAAACDAEAEHPTCQLVNQDWGIPVVVLTEPDLAGEINLPLRG
ncbi:MAG: redoxin domain-containing protein [Bifidobacteriaceae bacterium]|jgi:thiol-disulfide isomerase/thioredoxin|nr:redoxin domain-containing protein [Bifidobacteriaceae bacterium]